MHATDVLKYGNQTLLAAIDGLDDAHWTTSGVCGVWSVKDVLAHLASYEQLLVDILTSFVDAGPTPTLDRCLSDFEGFNDREVAARGDLSPTVVHDEYGQAHARVMELAGRAPVETLRRAGVLPWYGEEYDLEDVIAYAYYGHKREHSAQIDVFRDRLGA